MMQEEGAKNNPPTIEFATMTGPKSCKIGDLFLVEEDLIFSEHLLNRLAIKVSVSESHSDQSQYLHPLQEGDEVAVIRVSQTRYLVLDRVVEL